MTTNDSVYKHRLLVENGYVCVNKDRQDMTKPSRWRYEQPVLDKERMNCPVNMDNRVYSLNAAYKQLLGIEKVLREIGCLEFARGMRA